MLKRVASVLVFAGLCLSLCVISAFAVTATPTASTVLFNGNNISFDAYRIEDNNYFKLRDLAYVLNGTSKQFSVGWDDATDAILLQSQLPYETVGSEMEAKGAGDKNAEPTTSKIYLDGIEVQFTAFRIEGNNYFKLRDIGATFNFGVDWIGERDTIAIDTSKGYSLEGGAVKANPEPSFDIDASYAAYNSIIDAYATLEMSGYTVIDEDLIGDSLLAEQRNGTYNFGWDELPHLSYAYYDIDGDGYPELLIGVEQYGHNKIAGIYTLNNDVPESLLQGEDRWLITITTDSSGHNYIVYATGHMGYSTEYFHALVGMGMEYPYSYLGTLDAIQTEDGQRYRINYYSDDFEGTLITEAEYISVLKTFAYSGYEASEDVESKTVEFEWYPLVTG